jgi:hypothetical protein
MGSSWLDDISRSPVEVAERRWRQQLDAATAFTRTVERWLELQRSLADPLRYAAEHDRAPLRVSEYRPTPSAAMPPATTPEQETRDEFLAAFSEWVYLALVAEARRAGGTLDPGWRPNASHIAAFASNRSRRRFSERVNRHMHYREALALVLPAARQRYYTERSEARHAG